MKIPFSTSRSGMRFDLTPMIDIVFQLIIFFLAASHLARHETSIDIELPDAEVKNLDQDEAPERLVITVTVDGRYYMGDAERSLIDIEERLRQRAERGQGDKIDVHIRADRRARYHLIEPLMKACARVGIRNVKFPVLPPS